MTAETSRADSMSQVARSLLLDTSDAALQVSCSSKRTQALILIRGFTMRVGMRCRVYAATTL